MRCWLCARDPREWKVQKSPRLGFKELALKPGESHRFTNTVTQSGRQQVLSEQRRGSSIEAHREMGRLTPESVREKVPLELASQDG